MKRDFWLFNLFRHQVAGFIATICDFGILVLLTEVFHLWYVFSNVFGAISGALVNFLLSSYWAFSGSKNSLRNQLFKYMMVSFGSLFLNTALVYLLTDYLNFDYRLSKIFTAVIIAWTYNFLLMRYYVFRK